MALIVLITPVIFLFSSCLSLQFGYQSGGSSRKSGDSFASSVFYNTQDSVIYINGETNWSYWDVISEDNFENYLHTVNSDCFVAAIHPSDPFYRIKESSKVYSRRFGATISDDFCTSLAYVPSNHKNKFFTLGHTDENGFLTSLRTIGTPKSLLYGFLIGLDFDISQTYSGINVEGKLDDVTLLHDLYSQYPISITGNPVQADGDFEYIYLLSLVTSSSNPLSNGFGLLVKRMIAKTADEIQYDVHQAKLLATLKGENYESDIVQQTMKSSWTQLVYPKSSLEDISVNHNLLLSDILYVPRTVDGKRMDGLFIVGSTDGYGDAFGQKKNDDEFHQRRLNGFVSIFNPETGDLESSVRIFADDGEVTLRGICSEGFGKTDVKHIYVVGDTSGLLADDMSAGDLSVDPDGNISQHAFISKLNALSLTVIWTRQLKGQDGTDIASSGCAVAPNEEFIYIAGNVPGGEGLSSKSFTTTSAGKDDFFVASYDSLGSIVFLKQIGTSQDENMAKGRSIISDEDGNAIVFGSTHGSLARLRDQESGSDIFLLTVEKRTGKTIDIAEMINQQPSQNFLGATILGLSVGGGFILSCIAVYVGSRVLLCKRNRNREKNTDKILIHIENFSDPDYDLHIRHSATDGIHGIYGTRQHRDLFTGIENSTNNFREDMTMSKKNVQEDLMSFEENRQIFEDDESVSISESGMSFDGFQNNKMH